MAADENEKVYLPKMPVRKGFTHGYQGENIVVVDATGKETGKGTSKPRASRVVTGRK